MAGSWFGDSSNPVQLADPGDAGTITSTADYGVVPVAKAESGAETRTVSAPVRFGQRLLLHCTSYTGTGNVVITFPTSMDTNGNINVAFSATRMTAMFLSLLQAGALKWQYMHSDRGSVAGSGTELPVYRDAP